MQLEALAVNQAQLVILALLGFVDDFQAVDVLDLALTVFAEQATVLADIQRHHCALIEGDHQGGDHHQQHRGIAQQARAQQVGLATFDLALGFVADQATGVAHLVHDRIAGIDARRATDALHLQAVADVDAGGADLHAHLAIDAVAQALAGRADVTLARAAAFPAGVVVGDGQGVLVEHHALEARIRTHVHAHRFAQPTGVDVGGAGEEQHPEQADTTEFKAQQLTGQRADRGEIPDKGQTSQQADGQPQGVLGRAPHEFVQAPGRGSELDALVALAFGNLFAPHENPGPAALRAGVATPHAPGEHSDGKQAEGADDQQGREQDEILRPEGRSKNVELAFGQVPEHGLATAPVQPDGTEKQHEQQPCATQAQVAEQASETTGVDLSVAAGGLLFEYGRLGYFNDLDGNTFAHGSSLISLYQA
ncbi:hypothetical protein D9M71_413550 [compost metagenome]